MGIYLDHAATSPLRPEIKELITQLQNTELGNASSRHGYARVAKKILDDAREEIASILKVNYSNVVFTSGGTESDNLALYGMVRSNLEGSVQGPITEIIVSEIEHRAILNSAAEVGKVFNVPVKKISVNSDGVIAKDSLTAVLESGDSKTARRLVSIMASNNEIGSVQPTETIYSQLKSINENNVFHTDAVQGAGWLDMVTIVKNADMVSFSAHKLGGPVGVGLLIVKDGIKLMPQIIGGGQQRQRRSGTNDVISAAAMAMALKLNADKDLSHFYDMKRKFLNDIKAQIANVRETVPNELSVDGMCHITVDGVNGEELLFLLDDNNLAASAGSACSSGSIAPSHVLMAIGAQEFGSAFIRLSFGWSTTQNELDEAVLILKKCVDKLRR